MEIKKVPEDFIVKEITKLKFNERGDYSYFLLKKRNWNTTDVIKLLGEKLKIKEKKIGFAGNKDKNAVTEQTISIYKVQKERVENIKIKDVELKFLGKGMERINLGNLEGNKFVITIRNLKQKIEKKINQIPNYFDNQRFGVEKNNHQIGKALVKKDFRKACHLLKLEVEGKDYIKSLRKVGIKKLRFFINAYQSYLWNKLVCNILKKKKHSIIKYSLGELVFPKEKINNKKIPLPGFLNEKGYKKIFSQEEIKKEDFIIRPIPEISSEGGKRDMMVEVKDFKTISFRKDELNSGKFKQIIKFQLQKGSYATTAVKGISFINQQEP